MLQLCCNQPASPSTASSNGTIFSRSPLDCARGAGKNTLNPLELRRPQPSKYRKISHDSAAFEGLFVTISQDTHRRQRRPDPWSSGRQVSPRVLCAATARR